jgi:hypothetical protein
LRENNSNSRTYRVLDGHQVLVDILEYHLGGDLGGRLGGPVDCWLHVCGVSGVERQMERRKKMER